MGYQKASQSKHRSFKEAISSTFSGMLIAFAITMLFNHFPLYIGDLQVIVFYDGLNAFEALCWTSLMTIVSLIRCYTVRRYYNDHPEKED